MSYENLLSDKCDIYYLRSKKAKGNYGVPQEDLQANTYYLEEPDIKNEKCYIVEKSQTIIQSEPNRTVIQNYSAHFLLSADIKINSKIVWDELELIAGKPKIVKNRHQKVRLKREVVL